ncbi:MAG: hypothetical protein ACRDBP_01505 [Luteolibacter sp.]
MGELVIDLLKKAEIFLVVNSKGQIEEHSFLLDSRWCNFCQLIEATHSPTNTSGIKAETLKVEPLKGSVKEFSKQTMERRVVFFHGEAAAAFQVAHPASLRSAVASSCLRGSVAGRMKDV